MSVMVIVLTFLLTWIPIGLFWWAGGSLQSPQTIFLFTAVMWTPGLVALWAAKREGFRIPIFRMGGYLGAGLMALLLATLTVVISAILTHPPVAPTGVPVALIPLVVLGVGVTIKPLTALGEELMWRGYLWQKVAHLGSVRSALIIGTIWGLWHAPLVLMGLNYPGFPILGVGMMVVSCIAMTPIANWLRAWSGGVAAPAAFHGTLNAAGGVAIILFPGESPLLIGLAGVAGVIASACLWTLPLFIGRARVRTP